MRWKISHRVTTIPARSIWSRYSHSSSSSSPRFRFFNGNCQPPSTEPSSCPAKACMVTAESPASAQPEETSSLGFDGRWLTRPLGVRLPVWRAPADAHRLALNGPGQPDRQQQVRFKRAPAIADAEINRLARVNSSAYSRLVLSRGIWRSDRRSGRTERTAISSDHSRPSGIPKSSWMIVALLVSRKPRTAEKLPACSR